MTSDLLKLAPTMMSLGLLSDNYAYSKKKKQSLIEQGVHNIVGISLIKSVSDSL